jgi:hypothetical protein
MQMLIEHRQGDVGQQWRQNAALRRACVSVLMFPKLGQQAGFEE